MSAQCWGLNRVPCQSSKTGALDSRLSTTPTPLRGPCACSCFGDCPDAQLHDACATCRGMQCVVLQRALQHWRGVVAAQHARREGAAQLRRDHVRAACLHALVLNASSQRRLRRLSSAAAAAVQCWAERRALACLRAWRATVDAAAARRASARELARARQREQLRSILVQWCDHHPGLHELGHALLNQYLVNPPRLRLIDHSF